MRLTDANAAVVSKNGSTQMMRQRARPLHFALAWIGAAVLLLPLSVMIWTALGSIIAIPALLDRRNWPARYVLRTALAYGFLGIHSRRRWDACIGAMQRLVSGRYLRFDLRHWREVSALGGILVAGAVSSFVCARSVCIFGYQSLVGPPQRAPGGGLAPGSILLLFLGISVGRSIRVTLRRQAVAAALWVIAHLVSVPMVYALWQ